MGNLENQRGDIKKKDNTVIWGKGGEKFESLSSANQGDTEQIDKR